MNIERIKELLARWAELEPAQIKLESGGLAAYVASLEKIKKEKANE